MEFTVKSTKAATEFMSRTSWDEGRKISSFLRHLESLELPAPASDYRIVVSLDVDNKSYRLVASVAAVGFKPVKFFNQGFRQTYLEGWGTNVNSKDLVDAIAESIALSGGLGEEWKAILFLHDVYGTESFNSSLPPGFYSSRNGITKVYHGECQSILIGKGWQYFSGDNVYVYFPPEGWEIELESLQAIRLRAESQEQDRARKSLSDLQKYVGSVLVGVYPGYLLMQKPDGTQFKVGHCHSVWDYGDESESWLDVDGITLPNS